MIDIKYINKDYDVISENFKLNCLIELLFSFAKSNANLTIEQHKYLVQELNTFYQKLTLDVFQKEKNKNKLSKILTTIADTLRFKKINKSLYYIYSLFIQAIIQNKAVFNLDFKRVLYDEYHNQKKYNIFTYTSFYLPILILDKIAEIKDFNLETQLQPFSKNTNDEDEKHLNHQENIGSIIKKYLLDINQKHDLNSFHMQSNIREDGYPLLNVWSYFSVYFFEENIKEQNKFCKYIIENKCTFNASLDGVNHMNSSFLKRINEENLLLFFKLYPNEIASSISSNLSKKLIELSPFYKKISIEQKGEYKTAFNMLLYRTQNIQTMYEKIEEHIEFLTQKNENQYRFFDDIIRNPYLNCIDKIKLFHDLETKANLKFNYSLATMDYIIENVIFNATESLDFIHYLIDKKYVNINHFNDNKYSFFYHALHVLSHDLNLDALNKNYQSNNNIIALTKMLEKIDCIPLTHQNHHIYLYFSILKINRYKRSLRKDLLNLCKTITKKEKIKLNQINQLKTKKQNNALHLAIKSNNELGVINHLIKKGVSLVDKNVFGKSAYDYFVKYKGINGIDDDDSEAVEIEKNYLDQLLEKSLQDSKIDKKIKKI
jgi:hypothetical protein